MAYIHTYWLTDGLSDQPTRLLEFQNMLYGAKKWILHCLLCWHHSPAAGARGLTTPPMQPHVILPLALVIFLSLSFTAPAQTSSDLTPERKKRETVYSPVRSWLEGGGDGGEDTGRKYVQPMPGQYIYLILDSVPIRGMPEENCLWCWQYRKCCWFS